MNKVIDPSKCPICGETNQCAQEVAKATGKPQEPCWCMTATFSSELLDRVPEEAQKGLYLRNYKVIMIKPNYGRLIQHLFATFVAVLPSLSLGSNADQISITQARIEHEAGRAILIDIRESSEHQTGVAKNAVLLPMSQLLQKQSIIPKSSDKPILLICNTQNRSKVSLAKLKNLGYQNIQYVDGGMSEWAAKGWPMVKP